MNNKPQKVITYCPGIFQNAPGDFISLQYLVCHHTGIVCRVVVVIPFILDVPAGVTQEEGHTGFLHLPSKVLA